MTPYLRLQSRIITMEKNAKICHVLLIYTQHRSYSIFPSKLSIHQICLKCHRLVPITTIKNSRAQCEKYFVLNKHILLQVFLPIFPMSIFSKILENPRPCIITRKLLKEKGICKFIGKV